MAGRWQGESARGDEEGVLSVPRWMGRRRLDVGRRRVVRANIAPMENWDAVETVKRIRAGEVSAAEVLEATIKRAQAAGALNAIVTDTFERALESISAGTPVDGALAGLPMFVKDL